MDEILSILLGLVCMLAAVTLVGHGIWVVIAAVIRQFNGSDAPGNLKQRKPCPQCGAALGVDRGKCTVCGAVPQVAPKSQAREELLATARQLKRLQTSGAISGEQYEQLATVLARELSIVGAQPSEARERADQRLATVATPSAIPSEEIIAAEVIEELAAPRAFASAAVGSTVQHSADVARPARVDIATFGDRHSSPVASVSPFRQTAAPAPLEPAPPRPKLSDMLQGFLEESNIRWGEILAGFFIVVSSIGLVISLQSTLERIPYFPALLFTGFTVAFHGAGLYTLKRWNLHAISRVILVISLLLVPLTASAAVLMSRRGIDEAAAAPPVLFWLVLAVGTVALTWVAYTSSRELASSSKWRLTIAVIGCSLAQVLFHRLNLQGIEFWQLTLLASLPLGCFLVASTGQLILARSWRSISWSRARPTFIVLGVSLFAFAAAMAMLLMKVEPRWLAVARMTPILSLAAGSAAALGLLIQRRTTARAMAGVRTAGTVIWLLSGATMLLMVVLAWPQPGLLLAVGLVNAILLTVLAVAADLGLLYAPAIACLSLSGLIGFHVAQGRFAEVPLERMGRAVVEALLMGRSSLVLLIAAVLATAVAEAVRRYRSLGDARIILATSGCLAVLGVLIALFAGFIPVEGWSQDHDLAAPLLLVYAAVLLAAAPFMPWPYLASAGSAILFTALLQGLAFNTTLRDLLIERGWLPWNSLLAALVGHSVVSGAVLAGSALGRRVGTAARSRNAVGVRTNFIEPIAGGAVASLLIAVPLLIIGGPARFYESAFLAALAAVGWLAVALVARWKFAISGAQLMLLCAPALAIAAFCYPRLGVEWYRTLDHVGLQCLALAVGVAPWALARRALARDAGLGELLDAKWPSVDQIALGGVTLMVAVLAWSLAIPSIGWELGFEPSAPLWLSDTGATTVSPAVWTTVLVIAVSIGLLASIVERVRLLTLFGFAITTFALVAGTAMPWESVTAVASATRWWAGIYAVVWATVFIGRTPLRFAARSIGWLRWESIDRTAAHVAFGAAPIVLGALPVLVFTILAVAQNFQGVDLRGPEASGFFSRIGPTASYAVPLLAIVAVFLGYALRERESAFALAGSAVFQLAVNLAFILHITFAPVAPREVRAAECLQWNTLAAAGFAVVWLLLAKRMLPTGVVFNQALLGRRAATLVGLQVVLAAVGAVAIVGWAAVSVVVEPQVATGERMVLGGLLSYLSIALACVGVARLVALLQVRRYAALANTGFLLLAGFVALAAATIDRYDTGRTWLAYHTLSGGWLALLALGTAAVAARPTMQRLITARGWNSLGHLSHGLVAVLGLLVAVLAIRGNYADPAQPWWSFAASVGVMIAATILGIRRCSQPYAYASIAAAALTMVLFWSPPVHAPWRAVLGIEATPVFIEILTLTLIVAAVFWQGAEIFFQVRRNRSLDLHFIGPRSHVAVLTGVLLLFFAWRVLSAAFGNEPGDTVSFHEVIASLTVIALGVALVGALWDRRSLLALPGLFGWLAIAALLAIDLSGPQVPNFFDRMALMVLSAGLVVAVAGQAWSYGANLSLIGLRLGVSDPVSGLKRTERWLPAVTLVAAAATLLLALPLILTLPRDEIRIAVAFAPAAAAWGLACLADDERRPMFRLQALLLAGVSAIYLSWAQLGTEMSEAMWLTRVFRLLMVLSVLTFLYGLALPRWLLTAGPWHRVTRQAGYLAGAASIAAFIAVLVLEIVLFQPGIGAPVDSLQVLAIAVVLIVLIAGLISMALLPGRDPLTLSEKGKQVYVYAALATAALLFAHLYVCRPMWFDAGLLPYWPLIVMAIAFLGAGGGELFARYRLTVLAEPLTRVSSMLPLLPVLGMWIVAPKETDYALVLLVVGVLYLMLSVTQRSWASLLAAAVAANGALWSVLNRSGFELLSNPQLWIIPPALSVLLAAHLNRRRLPPAALTSIRYACVLLIYVSSTSEIFLRGVATSLWPAMILATLSVAGAFAGMMLRIRAFLYLGTSFALVSLMTMVAHAAQAINHVWPWWAFGVGMGIAILVLLGIFEKQREEVLRLIARLREWEQ